MNNNCQKITIPNALRGVFFVLGLVVFSTSCDRQKHNYQDRIQTRLNSAAALIQELTDNLEKISVIHSDVMAKAYMVGAIKNDAKIELPALVFYLGKPQHQAIQVGMFSWGADISVFQESARLPNLITKQEDKTDSHEHLSVVTAYEEESGDGSIGYSRYPSNIEDAKPYYWLRRTINFPDFLIINNHGQVDGDTLFSPFSGEKPTGLFKQKINLAVIRSVVVVGATNKQVGEYTSGTVNGVYKSGGAAFKTTISARVFSFPALTPIAGATFTIDPEYSIAGPSARDHVYEATVQLSKWLSNNSGIPSSCWLPQ